MARSSAGRWHLVRMRQRPRERQEGWLLFKSEDEAARGPGEPDILEAMPLSVKTGRSLEEIAADAGSAVWQSNRKLRRRRARGGCGPLGR